MEANGPLTVVCEKSTGKSAPLLRQLEALGYSILLIPLDQLPDDFPASPSLLLLEGNISESLVHEIGAKCGVINLLLAPPSLMALKPSLQHLALEICLAPCLPEEIALRIERSRHMLAEQTWKLDEASLSKQLLEQNLVGHSRAFRSSMSLLNRYLNIDASVLISGETGTGKELVARALHYTSHRKSAPFQALNCGALPDYLVENELFGHAKGAYTDARTDQEGLIAMAEGGTLFLDEVDCLPPKAQTALLRFVQDGRYRPVGGTGFRDSNVRIISATNQDLSVMAREKRFRQDLIFRLNTLSLELPPLRRRDRDVLLLARNFLRRCEVDFGRGKRYFHPAVERQLMEYDWPGNVRELESYVQRAYLLTDQPLIAMSPGDQTPPHCEQRDCAEPGFSDIDFADMDFANDKSLSAVAEGGADYSVSSVQPPDSIPSFSDAKKAAVDNFEVDYIKQVLVHAEGNVSRAARLAGKERRVFGRLMKKHRIEKARFTLA